ncbi:MULTISPECIES: phage tail assembly protein [Burkholderia cepacia complex]|uniref:phage tail assembly protein n=1 Tax=Burkholderia cepacia complex TaxID=87882 RepID=UPI001CF15131|nr:MULTISPECIES: phage tail assembly protein [Burkholderia cepacia complex]MCA8045475.1 phage tail assembly protein [Burkholderia arboris]MCA8195479.1 phage tail assembly protein [Burkholderia vietnamiensis]
MSDHDNTAPAAPEHPETLTLVLRKPIQMKGDTVAYSQLELREPTVDELDRSLKAGDTSLANNAALIAFITGIPVQAVRNLGKRDFEEAVTYLQGF